MKVEPFFENTTKGINKSEAWQEQMLLAEQETMDSTSLVHEKNAGQDTVGSIPPRSDDTVSGACAEPSTFLLRSHSRAETQERRAFLPEKEGIWDGFYVDYETIASKLLGRQFFGR